MSAEYRKTVHVIFKTHLDLGFTDMAQHVCSAYVDVFIPRALDLAEATRDRSTERFIWTTGAWLISYYLRVATPQQVQRMEQAIGAGDILWHALPFTTHTELMSTELFCHGLSIARDLDRRFGKNTIAGKMTDVPGHTRSMIPHLAAHGICYLHIGVNAGSAVVQCPPRFRWRHPAGEEIIVTYGSGYDAAAEDIGAEDLLHFAHTGDNHGPPTVEDVEHEFAAIRQRYPEHTPVASSLDQYARSLLARRQSLPIVTEEFGDTWIHGVGSDPRKVARFRCVDRVLTRSTEPQTATAIDEARQHLLLVAEHTWGKDEKSHLKDYANYGWQDFTAARHADLVVNATEDEYGTPEGGARYTAFEASWLEQRDAVDHALDALHNTPLHARLLNELEALKPVRRTLHGSTPWARGERVSLAGFDVHFCAQTGALTSCIDHSGQEWAANGPLAMFLYQSFDAEDFELFLQRYNPNLEDTESWARPDFTKPGLQHIEGLTRRHLHPTDARFERHGNDVWVEAVMPCPQETCYGAPRCVQLHYRFSADHIEIELQWFDKLPCRLPEASWIGFGLCAESDWLMMKMGSPVSPLDVAVRGNRALHALDSGLVYQDTDAGLQLQSFDAPLLSPGRPRILEFEPTLPQLAEGWHVNLHNNLWGTNFPMWFGEDMKFRFALSR